MPENKTVWNPDNHGIKEIKTTTRPVRRRTEKNHGETADHGGGAGCGTVAGCTGEADLRGN